MSEKKELSKFAVRALKRLESKKERKTARLFIPSLDEDIKIQSMTDTEIYESVSGDEEEQGKIDNYIIYKNVLEPNLKEIAKELKENGSIVEYVDVIEMFDMHERNSIVAEIMKLSGAMSDKKVKLIDSLKN